jgi:hypothetical protein
MAENELEPLDPVLWFESLGRLRRAARRSEGRVENRLRQSYYLANLAPPPFSALAQCDIEEAAFEALLEQAAFESAAVSLIGPILSFEIARTWPGPGVSARVWVEDISGEARLASGCVASALIQAWVELLLRFRKQPPAPGFFALPRARHESQSAPLRKPIWH